MSREKISEMVITLFEAKLNTYTAVKVDIWVKILERSGVPLDLMAIAFEKCLMVENTFPEPANIIAMCKPDFKSEAEENWNYIDRHIQDRGCGVSLPDGRMKDLVRTMGGLDKLGQMDDTEFSFARKEFVKRWCEQKDRAFIEYLVNNSAGLIENKNKGNEKLGN